ncbi:MAG: TadG family pilus assembly protein [Panacagrimonas sp.]
MIPQVQVVPRSRQCGSVLVNVAAGMSAMVVLLSVIDLGFLYFHQREYQKAADLGALAGAQLLSINCDDAKASAEDNVDQNLLGRAATVNLLECGTWSPTTTPFFTQGDEGANAIRVTVLGSAPRFLPFIGDRQLSANATAVLGDPVAAFSVGTRTARSDGGILGSVLAVPGLNLSGTTLLAYDGLADVAITPGGLLEELGIPVAGDIGIGDFNNLLAAENVSLGELLDATVRAAGQDGLLATNTSLLSQLALTPGLENLAVQLGSESGGGGLFAEVIASGNNLQSALDVGISALDIISTGIAVATGQRAIDVPSLNLNLLGLATVTTQVGLVEPPSIAIGGLGTNAICDIDEDCPTAYSAQVRTYIRVRTNPGLLGSLLKLDLPIVLDLTSATGQLERLCGALPPEPDGLDRGRVAVNSAVVKGCVGQIAPADLFSKARACDENLQPMELLNVAGLITLPNNSLQLDGLTGSGSPELAVGQTETVGTELDVGTLTSELVDELSGLLFDGGMPTPSGADVTATATAIFNDTASICSADTRACREQRLAAAEDRITDAGANSGLVSGLLNGVTSLLTNLLSGNGCTSSGLLGLGPGSNAGCITLLADALDNQSTSADGGLLSNTLAVLVGILQPVLDALGSLVLQPLLTQLGLFVGETDVNMLAIDCGGAPTLVD